MKPKINLRAKRLLAALPGRALIAIGLMINLAALVWARPGDVDLTFDAGSTMRGEVSVFVPLADGRLLIGGSFQNVSGAVRFGVARFQADGTLDHTFNPATGPGANYPF